MLESVMARYMVDHVPGIELRFPPLFIYKGIEQELRLPSYLALLARETFYSLILTACRGFIQDLLRNHCRDEGSEGGSEGAREREIIWKRGSLSLLNLYPGFRGSLNLGLPIKGT